MIKESTDQYGRSIAWIIVEGDTVNYRMVESVMAWWYDYYCPDNKTLEQLHNKAKTNKIGLWSDANPINPYEWRKGKRN